MVFGQRLGVSLRLSAGIDHQMVYRIAVRGLCFRICKEVSLPLDYSFLRTLLAALLSLENEAIALVEVYPTTFDCAVRAPALHNTLENVVVKLMRS